MASAEKISDLRTRFVSELRQLEHEVSAELKQIQNEIARLVPHVSKPHAHKSGTKSNTISILSGKTCPKCGKKGHDLRWHRWNDRKTAGHNVGKRAS
jgi:hypothetical protein